MVGRGPLSHGIFYGISIAFAIRSLFAHLITPYSVT